MIIFGCDWWDDWADRISRYYEILSWWFSQAHLIYDWGNTYNLTDILHQRLEREVKTLVFIATTSESLS